MTPKFARAVDPIFSTVLDLLDRIDRGQPCDPVDEKAKIVKCFDAASAVLGQSPEWNDLARYAMYAWIDSELAKVRPWEGREWWHSNSLELDYWGQGLANVVFFERAKEAAKLSSKDALEVFYVCVVLGFRGFYENLPEGDKVRVVESIGLPPDLRSWISQYAHAIRLGRELPVITDARRPADVAPPRYGKQMLLGTSLLVAIIAGIAVAMLVVVIRTGSG
ncbi:MAG TPA: DotU family type IV/VI secretion system protein [Pirellulaceae bacterium]|jgi:type VI secretion system protein ImpK